MTQSIHLKRSLLAAIGVFYFTFFAENTKPVNAASFTAVNFSEPTTNFTNGSWSLGFQFTTKNAVNVTKLGFYDDVDDHGNYGLTESHDVGIYDNAGQLLVRGTVNPGDALDGFFRYTSKFDPSFSSTQLQAGRTFFIAAATKSEKYTFNPRDFVVGPNITFVSSAFRFSNTLVFPGTFPGGVPTSGGGSSQNSDSNLGYFGPNFQADEVAAVPAPALLPGLIALGIGVWRKRKTEAAKPNE